MSNGIKDNNITETETFEIKRRVEDLPVTEADDDNDEDGREEISPQKDRQSSWPAPKRKYYLSSKDKTYLVVLLALMALFAILTVTVFIWAGLNSANTTPVGGTTEEGSTESGTEEPTWQTQIDFVPAGISSSAVTISADSIKSTNAVFLDVNNMIVTASRLADERTYPASLTKVMTLIVVVENLRGPSSLEDDVTVSEEVFKKMQKADASGAGLEPGEILSVESMIYALMLKSDGIAACELAKYISGSEEAFVELMNDTAARIGMEDTHFVNPTGLHDTEHYSTCRDLANMMAYAMKNDLCKQVMTEDVFVAPCTQANGKQFNYQFYHSLLVTQFDNLNKTSPKNADVIAGKTGYTEESGYCLVTYAQGSDGGYIVVTTGASSYSECISDYITIYEDHIA